MYRGRKELYVQFTKLTQPSLSLLFLPLVLVSLYPPSKLGNLIRTESKSWNYEAFPCSYESSNTLDELAKTWGRIGQKSRSRIAEKPSHFRLWDSVGGHCSSSSFIPAGCRSVVSFSWRGEKIFLKSMAFVYMYLRGRLAYNFRTKFSANEMEEIMGEFRG